MTTRPVPISKLDPADAFAAYLERSEPYFDTVAANGDIPWHEGSLEKRRELFDRRWTRPAPPEGLFTELADIRRPG